MYDKDEIMDMFELEGSWGCDCIKWKAVEDSETTSHIEEIEKSDQKPCKDFQHNLDSGLIKYKCKKCNKIIEIELIPNGVNRRYEEEEWYKMNADNKNILFKELMFHVYMKHTTPEWARVMLSFCKD